MRTGIVLAVAACFALGGCELLLDAAPMEEAEIGAGVGDAMVAADAVGSAAIDSDAVGSALISDELTDVADGVRLTPQMEGQLTQALRAWTGDGTRIGRFAIEGDGAIRGNGYALARIDRTGSIYASNGLRLGYFNAVDGKLYEYVSGSARAIGNLRGFTADSGVHLFADPFGNSSLQVLAPHSVVDVVGLRDGRFLVRLVGGRLGWVDPSNLTAMALLAASQTVHSCPREGDGVAVRSNGQRVAFESCARSGREFQFVTEAGRQDIPVTQIAYLMWGDGITGKPPRRPRYLLAFNGRGRFRTPSEGEFNQQPSDRIAPNDAWPETLGR